MIISKALEEAIDFWISKENSSLPIVANPTELLSGLLEELTETSVELQHLGSKLFIQNRV